MKNKYTLKVMLSMAFLLVLSVHTFAQNENYQFGRLEDEDMRMRVCPIDEEADAVIICDLGKIWFAREVEKFQMVYERFMRYKILTDEGVSNNTIAIPVYYEGLRSEKLSDLKVNVWNELDNVWKAIEIKKKAVNYKVLNDNYELAIVTLPGLSKGTIVEYKYQIISPFFMPVHGWEFQSSIPTLLSFLEIKMIPFYEYTFLHQGREPDIKETFKDKTEYTIGRNFNNQYGYIKYNEVVYHFGMFNTPATDENPMRIDFQLSNMKDINGIGLPMTNTWEKASKELLTDDRFGDIINKTEARAGSLIYPDKYKAMKPADRFHTIVRSVKRDVKWNGILGKYALEPLNEFIKTGEGNSGAVNLYTIGLLRSADLNAFPIILSTKGNPTIKTDYPFLHLYDYVIIGVRINDSILFSDATEPLLPDNMLPLRALNTRGLIVEKNNEKWITCVTPDDSETATSLVIHLSGSSELNKAELVKHAHGYDAFLLKQQFNDDKAAIAGYYKTRGYHVEPTDIITRDFSKYGHPYEITADIMVPAGIGEETVSIDPFLNEAINENPLKEESRTYSTDFYYPLKKTFSSEIIIPEGYTAVKIPEDFTMSNSLFVMNYKAVAEAGTVKITADYNMTKAIYPPSEYARIRSYLEEVVKRFNEPVVFQKGGL
jgi:hypothetical protein